MSREEQIDSNIGSKENNYINISPDKAREIRGYSILAKGDTPTIIDKEHFLVPSQSDSSKKYEVIHEEAWSCDCPDFKKRNMECKHIKSIKIFLKLRNSQDSDILKLKEEITEEKTACPYCRSDNIIKRGIRKTATEQKQRYFCKECKKRFVTQIIERTKVNAKMVTLVMDLYYKGNSLRDIKDTIKQFFNIDLHHETIRRYILKYTEQINNYVDKFTPAVSDKWHIDEQKIKTKKKDEWLWAWNVVDNRTRFLIANNITKSKSIEEAREIFKKAKEVTKENKQLELVTDGLPSYEEAIRKEFTTDIRKQGAVFHNKNAGIRKARQNNNLIERYHNQFREFDKVRRGFDRVTEWNEGFRLYNNFIKNNSVLGTTPALASAIDLGLGRNKWLSLLKQSLKDPQSDTSF